MLNASIDKSLVCKLIHTYGLIVFSLEKSDLIMVGDIAIVD